MSTVRQTAGFTLVEALVANSIVGLTVAAGLSAFAAELRASARAVAALELEALAQERMARLRLVPAEQLNPLAESLERGRFETPFDEFTWLTEVQPSPQQPGLLVAATTLQGRDTELRLETRLYRPQRVVANR